ncbi:MAG: hypothetical protein K8H90_08890, partial [Thermoanaerobaculia bacterium]|nr:hypothetical protein [Thermoanaerobaculia bacterium]
VMNQKLSHPASVPLDFLTWVGRDATWLRDRLAAQGVRSGYRLSERALEVTTVDALRSANRIRAFAFLGAPGLRPPYFDLRVKEADGALVRCLTLFPRSIAPGIEPMDFDREWFPAAAADPAILEMCRVEPQERAEFRGLDRSAFRERYFDANGDLKIEFSPLNTNAAFIAAAVDHGYLVVQQDVTGRLRLSPE